MPNFTPEEIVSTVDRLEQDRSTLHARMDGDMDAYHLVPYAGELDENDEDTLAGYKHFTSNDPQTVMNLALHLGSTAKRIIKVYQPRSQKPQREVDNYKELFCLGILIAADERRQGLGMPELQDAMFAQSLFRGGIAQRALLVKEPIPGEDFLGFPMTRTYVDITDWDPRNVYWAYDKHGLSWACEKSYKSRQQIIDEYDVDPAALETSLPQPRGEDDFSKDYAVYDYFDRQDNTVILESKHELKPRQPHGMNNRVPVAIAMAELRPHFQSGKDNSYDVYYGESLYRADRQMFKEQNFFYSVLAELAKRSIKQPLQVFSRDGSLTLNKGDPRVSGQEVSLSTANEEGILPMPPMEVVKEFFPFMGQVSAMAQRGTFSPIEFGEPSQPFSGYAMGLMRQGRQMPMGPHVKAVRNAYKQVLDILCDAYATGAFDPMQLYGRKQDPQRTYFAQVIPPQLIREGGIIEVDIVPQMPQDDAARVSLAQMLRDPSAGGPLADDRFIRETLDFQDPEQMERAVWEQTANRGSPMAIAWNSYQAALEQGDQDLAAIWWDEFQRQAMTAWLQTMQLMMLGAGPQPAPGGGGGNGNGAAPAKRAALPNSSAVPPQALGRGNVPNPAAATAGGQMGRGQPRPGAQGRNSLGAMPFAQAWGG